MLQVEEPVAQEPTTPTKEEVKSQVWLGSTQKLKADFVL